MKATAAGTVALAGVLLAACGGGGSRPPIAVVTSAVSSPTPVVAAENDPGAIVAAAVQACREKDGEKLRPLVARSVSDEEITRMLAGGIDVQLLSRSVPDASGDSVSIDVGLRITANSGETIVHRTWDLERSGGGVWRLTALPECY